MHTQALYSSSMSMTGQNMKVQMSPFVIICCQWCHGRQERVWRARVRKLTDTAHSKPLKSWAEASWFPRLALSTPMYLEKYPFSLQRTYAGTDCHMFVSLLHHQLPVSTSAWAFSFPILLRSQTPVIQMQGVHIKQCPPHRDNRAFRAWV